MNAQALPSTRPYLIRALYEWCVDNGFTPYVVVRVNDSVRVPREYVNNGEIVLNVSYDATNALQLGNDFIEFKARFGGRPHDILVPIRRVIAIYARENGQGMAFPLEDEPELDVGLSPQQGDPATEAAGKGVADSAPRNPVQLQSIDGSAGDADDGGTRPQPPAGGGRPSLKRVK